MPHPHAKATSAEAADHKGKRAPLAGGFWVTVKHADGSWQHVHLQGVRGRESKAQRAANDHALHHGAGGGVHGEAQVKAHRAGTAAAPFRQSPQQRDHGAKLDFLSGGQVTGAHKPAKSSKTAPKAKTLREHVAGHVAPAKAVGRGTPERAQKAAELRAERPEKAARLEQARDFNNRVKRAKSVMEARQSRAESAVREAGQAGGAEGSYARIYADRHNKTVARDRSRSRRAQEIYHANAKRRDESLTGRRPLKGAAKPEAAPPPVMATPATPAAKAKPTRTPRKIEAVKGTFDRTFVRDGEGTSERRPTQGHRVGTVGVAKSEGGSRQFYELHDTASGKRIAGLIGKRKNAVRAAAILDRFKVTEANAGRATREGVIAGRAHVRVVTALDRMEHGRAAHFKPLGGGQKVSEVAASRAAQAAPARSLREVAAEHRASKGPRADVIARAEARKATRSAPQPKAGIEEVPPRVLDRIKRNLSAYDERSKQVRLNAGLASNPAVGGGRRYLDEYRAKGVSRVGAQRKEIREFLALADKNGVDGRAVVKQLASESLARRKGDPLEGARSPIRLKAKPAPSSARPLPPTRRPATVPARHATAYADVVAHQRLASRLETGRYERKPAAPVGHRPGRAEREAALKGRLDERVKAAEKLVAGQKADGFFKDSALGRVGPDRLAVEQAKAVADRRRAGKVLSGKGATPPVKAAGPTLREQAAAHRAAKGDTLLPVRSVSGAKTLREIVAEHRKGAASDRADAAERLRSLHGEVVRHRRTDEALAGYTHDPFKGKVRTTRKLASLADAEERLATARQRFRKQLRPSKGPKAPRITVKPSLGQ